MQAFGYIRVSTEGQAENGVSLDAQRAKIAAWCDLNGYTLGEVFVDAGLSGTRADNRPALQQALAAVCRERGACLVVYSLSRLARNTRDTIEIASRLERAGVDLASVSERIDTSSAAGKMLFRLLGVMAEFESDQISERTTMGMQQKRRQSERVGAVPVGYDLAENGVQLVENHVERQIVETVKELRTRGYSMRAIAAELTARGIQTKQGGTEWKHSTIQRILARSA